MTLNGVIALTSLTAAYNVTEFCSFLDGLRKSGWRYTNTFCKCSENAKAKMQKRNV